LIDRLPESPHLAVALAAWLPAQRWFAAKHREVWDVRIDQRIPLHIGTDYAAEHLVITVTLDDGSRARYQVPLGFRARLPDYFADAALPGEFALIPYDAVRDPAVTRRYLAALSSGEELGPLRFHPLNLEPREYGASSRVLGVEQSNTSVVYGEELLIKFFRQLEPGVNPDIELLSALTAADCRNIAPLAGHIQTELDGAPTALAMAAQFVPNSADGWSMALTSVRDLFAEADLHADEVGTDFASEAERLGEAVAVVHGVLAETLGAGKVTVAESVVPPMRAGLDAAIGIVPELVEHRAGILAAYADAAELGHVPVQRIHGDLHLGQTLRSPQRWLLVDFEGEPLRPLADRRRPDSKLRDVAGMLRSFHYAGNQALGDPGLPNAAQRRFRAVEWVSRNTKAFCRGYVSVSGDDPHEQHILLRAYQLDKAVYEATYEARHRPDWLHLPLRAIAELLAHT
jgi:maltokinase